MNSERTSLRWLILFLILLLSASLSVFTGPGGFSLKEISSVIYFRLPRLMIGILAGGVLAVVGGTLQGIMRNPLVDPWTLGVASGAALGVSLAMISGYQMSIVWPVAAFMGGGISIVLVYFLAGSKGPMTITRLVLAGVIVNFFFSSLVMLVMVLGRRTLGEAIFLMMGHLGVVFTRNSSRILLGSGLVALAGCIWLISHSRDLDIISLNEEVALSLGIDATKMIKRVFIISSIAVGMVVAWTGAISFIGLVVPHLVRMLFGPKHTNVLLGSFVLGAGLLLLSDVLVRVMVPAGLPLSVVTGLIGVPFFIYLLQKNP